jgi:transcriptional regulator with XRE-family HTH domain
MEQHHVGRFIAAKRKEKNLTQGQLAERLHISNKTVSKWENGKCMPDYSIIEQLCEELDITVSELLEGKEHGADDAPDPEKYKMLLYKVQSAEDKLKKIEHKTSHSVQTGISFGCALAMVISYVKWQSVGWAIAHGCFGWGYVIYYLIKYL